MKLPFSMVPAGGSSGGVVAAIVIVALLAFAYRQAVNTTPSGQQPQR